MAARWFCSRDSKEIGPFAWQQMKQMAESGLIRPEDWVRTDVDPTWQPAQDCSGLFAAASPPKAAALPKARAVSPKSAIPPAPAKVESEAELPVVAPPIQKRTSSSAVPPVTPKTKSVQVPVGKSVANAPAIPKGAAIPSGTPAIPTGSAIPTGAAIPSGTSVAPSMPLGFVPPSTGMSTAAATSPRVKAKKKSGSELTILIAGGGIALVLMIVFAVVMMNSGRSPDNTTQPAATATNFTKPNEPAAKPAEIEAAAAAALGTTANAEVKTVAALSKTPDPLVLAVKKWNDAAAGKVSLKSAGVEVEISKLWFAADESGGEIEIAEEESATSHTPKFVCVQVKIDCTNGNPPLAYSGWSKGAVLVDEAGNTAPPLEISATPALHRINKASIRPGYQSEDVLVFPVASASMKLKLALPHKNLGIKSAGVFGFDLARMHQKGQPVLAETVIPKDKVAKADGEDKEMPADSKTEGDGEKMAKKPLGEVDEVDALVKKLDKEAREADLAESARKKKLAEEAMKKEAAEK